MELFGLFVTICGAASIAGWLMKWFVRMEG
jgi:hypothetical protein